MFAFIALFLLFIVVLPGFYALCRRPGFPAVRVVFPGHVGPSYTASVPSQLDLSIMTV